MSELNDLLTTRELQRWRLILGEAAETTLCGLDDNARQIDHALEWLYGRDPERLQRGERSGGLGGSNLTTPEWINSIHTLFPQQVIERLESDAVLRYGIEDVVTNLDVLERMQPSESLLRAVLHTKYLMNPEVLAAARRIVCQVVEEIMARLAKEVRQAFSGVRDRRRRSFIPLARNFDFKSTLRANLQHWHPQHGKLYIESPRFNSRIKRQSEQWQLVLLVDQSGSMVDSVIHSAVMAACLWQLQAFVEAKAQQAEFNHLIWQMRSEHVTSSDDPFASEEGNACRQYVQQLSQTLWLGGISQPLIHYEAAFNRALQAAETCNWRWVSESLRQLRASVDAFHARASHYNAGECLHQLAALNSRLNCAQEMARRDSIGEVPPVPWRTVVGSGIAGEAKLDHLRLVSLGMRCWQDIEHYGLRIWFTDPDTGSILHLSRSWPRSEQENSPAATRRLFSFQAGALAGGQIVSQAAKRSADGELLLATRNRLSSVVPLSPDAWQMLSAPLRQPGIVALREYLRQRPPACIRPLNQVDNLFILPVAECISLGWDSSRQTLDAQVISGEGEDNVLTLSLPASASAPYAVERMAALLQQTDDPVCLVSGFVSFVEGQLTLEPRVMMTKTRAWALDAETTPVAPLPSASVLPVPSTAHQLLIRCQALLIQLLHNGWRYQEQSAIGQAELLANDLTAVGFYRLAHVLGQFRNTESEARVEAMNNGVLLCEQLFPMLQQQG
ncbi:hypothetical protein BK346_01635 [Escherichia coli]|nr:hypothetical protein BK346_01635 [Escherichia coli]